MSRPFNTFDAKRYTPHPERIYVRPVSLAPTTMYEITDADIGLPDDPVAQARAEDYVRAAIAFRHRQHARAEIAARSARLAGRRTLIRTAAPADDADPVEIVPDAADMITAVVSVDRWQ